MSIATNETYLSDVCAALRIPWPDNHTVNIVCHGHSVPAGYFASTVVDTFNAYPHLLHVGLRERFPMSVTNVIVTAIGGENSSGGAARFAEDVLSHKPAVVTIDYGVNDRTIGLEEAGKQWRSMVSEAQAAGVKVILLTPAVHLAKENECTEEALELLGKHAEQITRLARDLGVGLADTFGAFERYAEGDGELGDLMSWANHPNRKGHEIIARELLRWFSVVA